jgi:hypothetical protein
MSRLVPSIFRTKTHAFSQFMERVIFSVFALTTTASVYRGFEECYFQYYLLETSSCQAHPLYGDVKGRICIISLIICVLLLSRIQLLRLTILIGLIWIIGEYCLWLLQTIRLQYLADEEWLSKQPFQLFYGASWFDLWVLIISVLLFLVKILYTNINTYAKKIFENLK